MRQAREVRLSSICFGANDNNMHEAITVFKLRAYLLPLTETQKWGVYDKLGCPKTMT